MDFPVVTLGPIGTLFNACSATGDTFDNGEPGTTVIFRNRNANPRIIRVISQSTCCFGFQGTFHDRLITIPGAVTDDVYQREKIDANNHNAGRVVTFSYDTAVAGLSCCVIAM